MIDALLMVARFAVLLLIVAGIASLSNWPAHRSLPEGAGVLTLSFHHGADRGAACRPATEEELAALPPNMRRKEICPRERPPIHVELEIDGVRIFERDVPPSGIGRSGPSRVHQRFVLAAGAHEIAVRMRDRPGDDPAWQTRQTIRMDPAEHRVIDFRSSAGGFVIY